MALHDIDGLIRTLRRTPMVVPQVPLPSVDTLIPHRPPFLLLDRLLGHDAATQSLAALRRVEPDTPVLAGHFPGSPVFPGSLQVEALAQAGACLLALSRDGPLGRLSLTRVHHALFLRPVLPDDTMRLCVRLLHSDPMLAIFAGQVVVEDEVRAVAVLEACIHG